MTAERYLVLIVLTLITVVGAVLTNNAAGTLPQFQLYFATSPQAFTTTLNHLEPELIGSLRWDTLFLIGYGLLLLALGWFQRTQTWFGYITMSFGILGAVLDVLENQKLIELAQQGANLSNMQQMQALCVGKFLCSAVAISSAALFFAGRNGWKIALRVILWVGSFGLMVGCLVFVVSLTLHADLNDLAASATQIGLLVASFGLLLTIVEYGREWRNSSFRPF